MCFSLVTVYKLCPSPHVYLDCFPSWGDFIEKMETVTFAFLWLCVTAAACACPHPCSLSLLCEVVSFVMGKTHSSTSAVVPLLFPLGFCLTGLSLFCFLFPPLLASAFAACKQYKMAKSLLLKKIFLSRMPDHPPAALLSLSALFIVRLLKGHSLPTCHSPETDTTTASGVLVVAQCTWLFSVLTSESRWLVKTRASCPGQRCVGWAGTEAARDRLYPSVSLLCPPSPLPAVLTALAFGWVPCFCLCLVNGRVRL